MKNTRQSHGCLFEVERGEMVVTGGETVVAPNGVAGGSSEEETGCRLVELDASSNIVIGASEASPYLHSQMTQYRL